MSGKDNLIPFSERTEEEQRQIRKKGGVASGKARRNKKDLRKALEALLEKKWTDKNGKKLTGTEAITTKLFEQAMKGNVKAFETIRATVGQDPVHKIEQVVISEDVRQEVEDFLNDGQEEEIITEDKE